MSKSSIPKRLIQKFLNNFGLEIHRKQQVTPRASMRGCLKQVIEIGLQPQTVIDVGAAKGTPSLYESFPDAKYLLIEPLSENIPELEHWTRQLKGAEYVIAAANSTPGEVVINVHPDLVGSSLYLENEDSDVNGFERTVPAITLDQICQEKRTKGPYLIKIDTQGSELDVLRLRK